MDPAHVSRLKEEQERSLEETLVRIKKWEKFDDDYTALQDRLRTLPDKVSQNIMVPFGPVAFMPGQIVHTNEIMVLLGDNWFAERSAKQACEIIDRRKEHLNSMLSDLAKQRHLLESRLGFTSELKDMSEGKGDLVDIREEYDPEKEAKWREERKRKKRSAAAASRESKPQEDSDPSAHEASLETPPIQREDQVEQSSIIDGPLQGEDPKDSSPKPRVQGSKGTVGERNWEAGLTEEEIWMGGVRGVMSEEELWARLDELERQEEVLDELALMSDGEVEPTDEDNNERHASNNEGRHVRWSDEQNSDNGNDDSDPQVKAATITFKHTEQASNDDKISLKSSTSGINPTEIPTAAVSPADIYNQYVSLPAQSPEGATPITEIAPDNHSQPLKSILKHNPKSHLVSGVKGGEGMQRKAAKNPVILPSPLSAFSGQVTERADASANQNAAVVVPPESPETKSAQPKRVSRFKAARQQQR
ncbi:unconventional prefoldin RPB5 interactor-like [Patiria miniata]|uniref:Protein phosphatase 1 regulatory subunit 19 n=1 Tax=Patiria miniata TaxID=46514 RepID=A0A914ASG7_PATMI|nr:unconventional prefoldin RPB5 interactor-like [Patiria miniata]